MTERTLTGVTSEVTFVGDLPNGGPGGGHRDPRYDQLAARPGVWAEYWGSAGGAHSAAKAVRRDGVTFEARVRNGKAYIRAVSV